MCKGFIGGMFISLGAFAYLITLQKTNNPFLASMTFYLGLSLVMLFQEDLFTGQVLTEAHLDFFSGYVPTLVRTWMCNFVGSIVTTILLNQILHPDITQLVANKLASNYMSVIISGMFCNILVCCAVATYRGTFNHIMSWFFITCFVLLGLEHSIADMTYYTLAYINGINTNIPQMITYILLATIGNIIGGRVVVEILKSRTK